MIEPPEIVLHQGWTPGDSPLKRANAQSLHFGPVVHVNKLRKGKTDEGLKLVNDYIVLSLIGMGTYSKVKLCCHRVDHTYYAMKILDRARLKTLGIGKSSAIRKITREIAILKKLRHNNIIALQEVIDDPSSNKLYLVFEHAGYGPVLTLDEEGFVVPDEDGLRTIPEARCKLIMRDLVSGLAFAHENGVAHRDIKPENILVTEEGEAKLCDFGVSSFVNDPINEAQEGTIAYLPPELLLSGQEATSEGLMKADVWALGVSLFVMFFGRLPWGDSQTALDILEILRRTSIRELIAHHCSFECSPSPQLLNFLESTMCVDVCKRPTAFEVASHPWLKPGLSPFPEVRSGSSIDVDMEDMENAVSSAKIETVPNQDVLALPPRPRIFYRSVPCYYPTFVGGSPDTLSSDTNSTQLKNSMAFDDSVLNSVQYGKGESPLEDTVTPAEVLQLIQERHRFTQVVSTPGTSSRQLDGEEELSRTMPPLAHPLERLRAALPRSSGRRCMSVPASHRWFARRVVLMGKSLPPEVVPVYIPEPLAYARRRSATLAHSSPSYECSSPQENEQHAQQTLED